eukprot:801123_1
MLYARLHAFVCLFVYYVAGVNINITNPSFEVDAYPLPNNTVKYYPDYPVRGVTGWSQYDPHGVMDDEYSVGVQNPSGGSTMTESLSGCGIQSVYIEPNDQKGEGRGNIGIEQVLSNEPVTGNTIYTLSAYVGNPDDNTWSGSSTDKGYTTDYLGDGFPGSKLQLLDSTGVVLAEDVIPISESPSNEGTWTLSTAQTTIYPGDPSIGRDLKIRLININEQSRSGFQVVFDCVSLTAEPTTTVAPSLQPTATSSQPTHQPSVSPTRNPTTSPTKYPTKQPITYQPTHSPSDTPSRSPTNQPSQDMDTSTAHPMYGPTLNPTLNPTPALTTTKSPSPASTDNPTVSPSVSTTLSITTSTLVTGLFDTTDGSFSDISPINIMGFEQSVIDLENMYRTVVVTFTSTVIIIGVAAWIDSRFIRTSDYLHVAHIGGIGFQILDMISDCFFTVSMSIHSQTDSQYLVPTVLSAFFIVFPASVTIVQLYLHSEKHWLYTSEQVRGWLSHRSRLLYLLSTVTGSSFAAVSLV